MQLLHPIWLCALLCIQARSHLFMPFCRRVLTAATLQQSIAASQGRVQELEKFGPIFIPLKIKKGSVRTKKVANNPFTNCGGTYGDLPVCLFLTSSLSSLSFSPKSCCTSLYHDPLNTGEETEV